MRQTGVGGVLGESLPGARLEEFLPEGIGERAGPFLGSSGRRERTGGGTVRMVEGEAGEEWVLPSLGREENGRSMGSGLEEARGAMVGLPGVAEDGRSGA